MQSTQEVLKDMMNRWNENPALLMPIYKDACPGITDDEALTLAQSFAGLFKASGRTRTRREQEAQFRAYLETLEAARAKYPGGDIQPFSFTGFDA